MMDKKDEKILDELKKDSRLSTKKLSTKLGIKRTTLRDRIIKMKRKGIIKLFTAIPDYKQIGEAVTIFLLITFRSGDINGNGKREVSQKILAERIANFSHVYEVHIITGEYDLLVKARGKSLNEIGELVVGRIRNLKGVMSTYTLACFETITEKY